MFKLTRELVESFANSTNLISYNNSFNTINYYIDESMKTIMQRNSYIKSYKLYIANEALSGTTFNASSLDVFLCLDAKQIELNFLEKKTIAFKHMFKDFYKNFRENFTVFKKKKTSEKKLKKDEQKLITNENYNIIDFYKDLQIQLCKQLYKTTKIGVYKNCLRIIGGEEFGQIINIYPVFLNNEQNFVIYNLKNKKTTIIDFRYRFINLDILNDETKGLYKPQIRIFNNIYYNIFKQSPNQIFIESMLYNVPSEFFTYNIYETTVGIINYLKNFKFQNMVSICNSYENIFNEPLNTIQIENAYRFIKSLTIEN